MGSVQKSTLRSGQVRFRLEEGARSAPPAPCQIRGSEDPATGKAKGRWMTQREDSEPNVTHARAAEHPYPLHMAVRLAPPLGSCQANPNRDGMKNGADYVSASSHDVACLSSERAPRRTSSSFSSPFCSDRATFSRTVGATRAARPVGGSRSGPTSPGGTAASGAALQAKESTLPTDARFPRPW
jgi:hypothetical protein